MTEGREHREQDKAARSFIKASLGNTLFVEAGAGTGKTGALVDRVVALIVSGVPVDRIAAITFTERAAGEMRDRVRSGLEDASRSIGPSAEIAGALGSLDRAQISTIHAFCQSLLKSLAAQAGVDPDFSILDEVSNERRRQEKWREEIERLATNAEAVAAIDRVLSLGLTTRDLESLAMELLSSGDLAEEMARTPAIVSEPVWPDLSRMARRLDETRYRSVPEEDKLRKRIETLAQFAQALSNSRQERKEMLLAGAPKPGKDAGNAPNWGGKEGKASAFETATEVAGELVSLRESIRRKALSDVVPYMVRFVRDDASSRGREGTMTFDDLILRVRDLLATSVSARQNLRDRFDVLLIDEFQDTDPLQVDIAMAFATDPASGEIEPGRLFLVGDPKQSIYRFRGADMAVYSRAQTAIEGTGGLSPELRFNKRSRKEILDWVNRVFAPLIGDGSEPEIQPAYKAIHAERDVALRGPGVGHTGGEVDERAAQVRALDAQAVASLCRQAIEERWEVQERNHDVRAARFQDIAILIPSRTGLTALERSLVDGGVPYRVESGSLIYRTQEIRDLLNCLTAMDDPNDEVAIVGALRSPAFACSDADLAQFARMGGKFNYLSRKNANLTGPVAESLAVLAEYHSRRHDGSLAALIERFASERGLVETGILHSGDRNGFRRVRYLAQQARAFEGGGPESLRSLIAWLERMVDRQMLDNEGSGVDSDEDAVQIHTVHGSKGLEFPIVIAAGLSASPGGGGKGPCFMRDRAGTRYAVSVGSKGSDRQFVLGNVEELRALGEQHAVAEFRRLLYVGATRARDHLVVSLYHNSRQNGSAAAQLIGAGAFEEARQIELAPSTAQRRRPFAGLEVDLPTDAEKEDLAAQRRALVAGARRRWYTSATAIKAAGGGFARDSTDEQPERSDETEPWSRGRARTRLGRAVHATIQSLPLNADTTAIAAFSRAQAVAEAVPHLGPEVEGLVRWIVERSEAWQRATSATRALREVPFALETDGKVLEGFIDLVIETPEGLEIVDWKTDHITAGEVSGRLREYALQAGLYVYGLREATGLLVSRVTYVFASARVETSPGTPGELEAAARTRLTAAHP